MPAINNAEVHVVPYREAWAVEALGIKYVEFATLELALNFGRLQAEKNKAPLFVHDRNGDIVESEMKQSPTARRKNGAQAA